MKPANFRMSKEDYKAHLSRLIVALVRKHGELTVGAVHEMANRLIITHGVRDAAKYV